MNKAIAEGLRVLARYFEQAEDLRPQMSAPAAPEVDYSELNYKSLKEAAKALGMSVDKIYTIVHRADFPGYKVGERWYIPKAELAEWNSRMARERVEL